MLELMNAHQLAVFGEADVTADELRTWLTSPSVDVERDIRVLEQDGRLVGYVDVDPTRDEPPLWWCDLKVAPDADTRRDHDASSSLARAAGADAARSGSGPPPATSAVSPR